MKPLGSIRRVDDLGRVVIPKKVRKALNIREGDRLDVFVQDDTVVCRKYSPVRELVGGLTVPVRDYIRTLYSVTNVPCVLTDTSRIVTVFGLEEGFVGQELNSFTDALIKEKIFFQENYKVGGFYICDDQQKAFKSGTIQPIFCVDSFGSIMLVSYEPVVMGYTEARLLSVAANFLSSQLVT
jgi:stage V sporulation protein T